MSCKIAKLMQIPMNTLCYLIKLVSLFPSYVITSLFVALSIFATLSNFCRIIKLLPSWSFKLFFLGVYISLVISQDIPSCETFSRAHPGPKPLWLRRVRWSLSDWNLLRRMTPALCSHTLLITRFSSRELRNVLQISDGMPSSSGYLLLLLPISPCITTRRLPIGLFRSSLRN